MGILLMIHSLLRWVIVVVALVAIVRFAMIWRRRGEGDSATRPLMAAFTGLMDLQLTLGLVLLLWGGFGGVGWPRYRLEHSVTMIVAVALLHLAARRWRTAPAPLRARNYLLAVVASFLLIGAGIAALPQGWLG